MNKIEKQIQNCKSLLASGNATEAKSILKQIHAAKLRREFRLPLAELCRRAGYFTKGLNFLTPVVLKKKLTGYLPDAQPNELAEYGALLLRLGALSEAYKLLSSIDKMQSPQAHLYLGFYHFARWENSLAMNEFSSFLNITAPGPKRLIGEVNFLAALIETNGRKVEIEKYIHETILKVKGANNQTLLGNCYELKAQFEIRNKEYSKARRTLELASELLNSSSVLSKQYVEKWKKIAEGFENKNTLPLLEMRKNALAERQWESVRELDFFILKIKYDPKRFHYLFFGTPFDEYRTKMLNEIPEAEILNSVYRFGHQRAKVLDLRTFQVDGEFPVKANTQTHQLLSFLMYDFYKPASVGYLFSKLFTNELFDLNSSKNRVHKAIERARKELSRSKLPIEIEEIGKTYRVKLGSPFAILVSKDRKIFSDREVLLNKLKGKYLEFDEFSVSDVGKTLNVSKSKALYILNSELNSGAVERRGTGPSTRYRFKKN